RTEVLFEDKGYHTTTAWGGQEAIRRLQSGPFDLVLLSDYLPDVNSEELWRALAHLRVRPSVAILETAHPVKEIANHYQRLGGRCILDKALPYKIVEAVHQCLSSEERHPLNWEAGSVGAGTNAQVAASGTQDAE
ncbi:MAG: hypothetical protein KGM47_19135, partial [Acidobacteriota bacterium]|nr:hypothetical protein [Acidobacteriota bacterium]